jgi:hypothetical protein
VIDALRLEMPELGRQFRLIDPAFEVPATDGLKVATWAFEPMAPAPATCGDTPPGA